MLYTMKSCYGRACRGACNYVMGGGPVEIIVFRFY